MQRDARAYLWDALQAVKLLRQFGAGKSFEQYQADQLSKVDGDLAAQVPDLGRIVAFRNILIHGYATVDDALVWQVFSTRVPGLATTLSQLLDTAEKDNA